MSLEPKKLALLRILEIYQKYSVISLEALHPYFTVNYQI